jgi:peptidoglycan/LPS O-acetylase OafA/YrhL
LLQTTLHFEHHQIMQPTNAFQTYKENRIFASLNGLRAISIIAVIWHHTAGKSYNTPTILSFGYEGVALFFLISGFLITTLLLREKERNGSVDLPAFFVRRSLRIFPLYFAVLGLYVVLVNVFEASTNEGQNFFKNLIFFATYTSNIFVTLEGRVIFYYAWSLAAEEQFYLICAPLLSALKSSSFSLIVSVATLLLVTFQVINFKQAELSQIAPIGLWLGTLCALALHYRAGYNALYRILGAKYAPLITLGFVLASLELNTGHLLFIICGAALLISCVIQENHRLQFFLNWAPINYIGKVSYGLYLLHMFCNAGIMMLIKKTGIQLGPAGVFIVVLALSLVIASLSFNTFEKFFLQLKPRFER